jgi:signal transduction histidine kinase
MRLLTSLLDLKNKELTIKEDAIEIRISNSRNKVLKLELGGSALLIVSILVILLLFWQRSKTKLKQQQIASARSLIEFDEAEKGKLGSELHDNIGYLVRIIDKNIQAINFPDPNIQENIRSQLGDMGETIRKLSHRMNPLKKEETPFKELFADIVNDMRNLAGVNVKYFVPDKLPELSKEITLHLCRITQELLTNASKYAKESSVLIRVGITSNHILLLYSDDGPGFDKNSDQVDGIGLRSIKARVNILNGESILTTEPGSGTKWEITIPLR